MDSEMITMADACAALIKTEENTSLTFAEKDYLHRAEFVDNVFKIVEYLSDNNSCTTFAIDGAWGCGKSFVLNMLQDKLLAEQVDKEDYTGDRYVVFHYNSWKYDYYDEPLIAIVSAILDSIERNKFISTDVKEKVRKTIGVLASVGGIICKAGCGIDPVEEFKKIPEEWRSETSEQAKYDPYYVFKEVLKKLKATLADIAKKQTVVVIVDELDRCLPEYAIKVMERLHHLTEDAKNLIVMMAIDKEQLKKSVKKAFGFDNAEQYLKKFIQFYVSIDEGVIKSGFIDGYVNYYAMFEINDHERNESIGFVSALFSGIDNRKRQHIMEKAFIIHKLLFHNKKKDYSFMCAELLFLALNDHYHDCSLSYEEKITKSNYSKPFSICKDHQRASIVFSEKFNRFFDSKYNKTKSSPRSIFNDNTVYCDPDDPYHALFYYWVEMHNKKLDSPRGNERDDNSIYVESYDSNLQSNIGDLRKYISYFSLIV